MHYIGIIGPDNNWGYKNDWYPFDGLHAPSTGRSLFTFKIAHNNLWTTRSLVIVMLNWGSLDVFCGYWCCCFCCRAVFDVSYVVFCWAFCFFCWNMWNVRQGNVLILQCCCFLVYFCFITNLCKGMCFYFQFYYYFRRRGKWVCVDFYLYYL